MSLKRVQSQIAIVLQISVENIYFFLEFGKF